MAGVMRLLLRSIISLQAVHAERARPRHGMGMHAANACASPAHARAPVLSPWARSVGTPAAPRIQVHTPAAISHRAPGLRICRPSVPTPPSTAAPAAAAPASAPGCGCTPPSACAVCAGGNSVHESVGAMQLHARSSMRRRASLRGLRGMRCTAPGAAVDLALQLPGTPHAAAAEVFEVASRQLPVTHSCHRSSLSAHAHACSERAPAGTIAVLMLAARACTCARCAAPGTTSIDPSMGWPCSK